MTWSIVARDPETGFFGIAVATRLFAVGALCPWTEAKVGAIASQALVNPSLGPHGLALLREGYPAPAALDVLMRGDEGRAIRQVHLIDAAGQSAAYTGAYCIDWAGQRAGEAVSVAGNMLVGPAVIEDTLATYRANMDTPFVERLLLAMDAGEAAGRDKRGKDDGFPSAGQGVGEGPGVGQEFVRSAAVECPRHGDGNRQELRDPQQGAHHAPQGKDAFHARRGREPRPLDRQ